MNADILEQDIFGLKFRNPIGSAAGLCKNGYCSNAIRLQLDLGHIEMGSVTSEAYNGNPKGSYTVFETKEIDIEKSFIYNDIGLKNVGAHKLVSNLNGLIKHNIVGISIVPTPYSKDPIDDVLGTYTIVKEHCDYITLNFSCKNAGDYNFIKNNDNLSRISRALSKINKSDKNMPLFLKMDPDLSDEDFHDQCEIALENGFKGLIIGNSSYKMRRDINKYYPMKKFTGTLSGYPLLRRCLYLITLASYKIKESKSDAIIIGCGGIHGYNSMHAMMVSGASLIQSYAHLHMRYLDIREDIKNLSDKLEKEGVNNIKEIIGSHSNTFKN